MDSKQVKKYVDQARIFCQWYDFARNYFFEVAPKSLPTWERTLWAVHKADQILWLVSMHQIKPKEARELGFADKIAFYHAAIEAMNQEAQLNGWQSFKLTTLAGLRKRAIHFSDVKLSHQFLAVETMNQVISGTYGNNNAMRLGNDQRKVAIGIFADGQKLLGYKRAYKTYCERVDYMLAAGLWNTRESTISFSGFCAFLKKPEIKIICDEHRKNGTVIEYVVLPTRNKLK